MNFDCTLLYFDVLSGWKNNIKRVNKLINEIKTYYIAESSFQFLLFKIWVH